MLIEKSRDFSKVNLMEKHSSFLMDWLKEKQKHLPRGCVTEILMQNGLPIL
jgi:hypothetical protein